MKKLLVGLVSLAFAGSVMADGMAKHMVRMYGFEDGGNARSVDFSMSGNDIEDAEESTMNIALNYAYAINNQWQVGGTYKNYKMTKDGDVRDADNAYTTIGLSGYYNFGGESLTSTCYVALHYNMTSNPDHDDYNNGTNDVDGKDTGFDTTDIVLEYGHRFEVGHAWGMHLTYAPSVSYTMSTKVRSGKDANGDDLDDIASTALAWNWIKFDVLF